MFVAVRKFFRSAPHRPPLPADKVAHAYRMCRFNVFQASFFGYCASYLCRSNLAVVAKEMQGTLHYTADMIGNIMAVTAIAYGLSKFLMGGVSDRCNPRKFMAASLFFTALANFAFGASDNYHTHLVLWGLNGVAQGMCGPPFSRILTHWFSPRERGTVSGTWNISHNIGGGLAGVIAAFAAGHWGWSGAFFVPGVINLIFTFYLLYFLRDTPQSEGLPPVEEYRNDYTDYELQHGKQTREEELGTRDLFVNYIFKNKLLWLFAAANFFVYVVRYGMLDWAPLYLSAVKGANLTGGGVALLVLEFGGIPSTLLMGWLSDKIGGRRGLLSFLCMWPIVIAFLILIFNPPGYLWIDMGALMMIGCFIYPPVLLLTLSAIDSASKKAAGAAAGFIGLWGYIGRTAQAKGFGELVAHYSEAKGAVFAWECVLWIIVGCALVGMTLLFFTRNIRPKA